MKIVIDDKIPYIREAISRITADAVYKKGTEISAEDVRNADALIVRTRTRCDEKLLKGFERVALEPGETKRVTMTLTPKDLSLVDAGMRRVVEPGEFDIQIGASSTDIRLSARIEVLDPAGHSERSAGGSSVEFPVTLGRGGEVTLPVRGDRDIGDLAIRWGRGTDCAFEILISDGGGQFLPVFAGEASSGGLQRCTFDPVKASEIRVSITRGKAVVDALESDLIGE